VPGDILNFDTELKMMIHIQIDNDYSRQCVALSLSGDPLQPKRVVPTFMSAVSKLPWEYVSKCRQSNFMFSPNLLHYLTFDTKLQSFIIYRVDRGSKQRVSSKIVLDGLFN
jgi:hypothetical protein